MSLSVQIGLVLALATALTSIVGFLYKHRGAVDSPPVTTNRPVRSSLALFRSRWYVLGILIAFASWGFHSAALALAPISLVQTVIAGGLVLLTVIANRLFGFTITKREWIGVALTAIGLAFLAATLGGTGDEAHADWETGPLSLYVAGSAGLGVAAAVVARRSEHGGTLLALSAGLIWGASDVSIKAVSVHLDEGVIAVLTHPLSAGDPRVLPGGDERLGPQPPGGQGRARDRRDQCRREHLHDRVGPTDLRRAGARRHTRAGSADSGVRLGDRGRVAHSPADPCSGGAAAGLGASLTTLPGCNTYMRRTTLTVIAIATMLAISGATALADTLLGTGGADTLNGTPSPDQLYGEAGDDLLNGIESDDYLEAGSGNDRLNGGAGADLLLGGTGEDSLVAGPGADVTYAGAGEDTVLGDSGDDTVFGQAGADRLFGGSGRDRLYASGGGDVADGGSGSDRITGSGGGDTLIGGSGDDVIVADGGPVRVRAGRGRDRIRTGSSNDVVSGGSSPDGIATGRRATIVIDVRGGGRDRVECGRGRDTVEADSSDQLRGCEDRVARASTTR